MRKVTVIEGIPGINETIRLKDLPKFFQVKVPNYGPYLFFMELFEKSRDKNLSMGVIVNTFEELEPGAVQELSSISRNYSLYQMVDEAVVPTDECDSLIEFNLVQEEDLSCLAWLDSIPPNLVLLVSFGTTGFLKPKQLDELAWRLADSQVSFLWVIRSDLITRDAGGGTTTTATWSTPKFELAIKDRGLMISWCPQEKVLRHPEIGGYLTHCGWNSLLEYVSAGVPLLCWPIYSDQTMNSWISRNQYGNGIEIANDVRREEVVRLVREVISGQKKGKEMKQKALEWKKKAEKACRPNDSSFKESPKNGGSPSF